MKHHTWFKFLLPVALLGLMVLFGRIPSAAMAAASSASRDSTQIVRGNASWALPAGQCSRLPAGLSLSGNGKRYSVITTRVNSDGSLLTINNDFVQGTAKDNHGGTYDFLYANQDRHQMSSSSASMIDVDMTDVFTLSGNGGANNYTVSFKWTWSYSSSGSEWPPVTNWHKIYTQGDPINCDPL